MIRSMTGFGAAAGPIGSQQVTLELRTVNHRFFNPSIKLPSALSQWEGELREQLRKGVARGHVTAVARIERAAAGMQEIDEQKVARYADLLRGIQQRHQLDGAVDLATILRFPDVLASEPDQEHAGTPAEVQKLAGEAIDALTRMREVEGTRLAALLDERITMVEGALRRIAARAPGRLVAERERLRKSVKELTEGVDLDQQRLAQEIALLADRLDVSEEVDRFRSHISAFRETLSSGKKEPVGKRLGFLLQEMLREANTTGSKSKDAAMLHDVVAVKEELERIAEQVENIE
ncbi:MAG TPA: YicC/YloC family endoribonuclease [Gemmatimonadaceae bacterium]|nr:YicC/YloC family endoribonuclease [Gemmatimonadaceae bacterium]